MKTESTVCLPPRCVSQKMSIVSKDNKEALDLEAKSRGLAKVDPEPRVELKTRSWFPLHNKNNFQAVSTNHAFRETMRFRFREL